MDYKHIGWKKCDFCGMETSWNGIHGMEFHGTELMEWK